jgi:tetratricopeptide (TPR) repeat protein
MIIFTLQNKALSGLSKYFLFCFLVIGSFKCFSQNRNTDSLHALLKKDKEDTAKVQHLNALGWELMYNNPDTAIILGDRALALSEELKWKKGVANSVGSLGVYNYLKGDYLRALDYYLKALTIDEELNDKRGIAKRLGYIGIIYWNQGDYPKALDYYFRALKMDEALGNENGIGNHLGNIGIIYMEQADYPKALYYYFMSLKLAEKLGDKSSIIIILGNIGNVYGEQKDNSKSLEYYFKALKMAEELGDKNSIAAILGNIGNIYAEQKDNLKALDYYFKALKLKEELGDKNEIAVTLGNIGSAYTEEAKSLPSPKLRQKMYASAEKHLSEALKMSKEIGVMDYERQFEELLSKLFVNTNRHQLALEHYKKAMALKDTLFSAEKNKEITRKEMNYDFEKKTAAAKSEQDKKDAVAQIIIYSVSGGFLLVLLLAVFIFKGYRQKQKANEIISAQKLLVEEKQKEILDSIHYAKRIQQSLLPTEKYIGKNLKMMSKNWE